MAVIIPQNITFPEWVGFLQCDWPNANIPTVIDEDWRKTARIIIDNPNFSPFSPPMPDGYAEPIEWIKAFSNVIY